MIRLPTGWSSCEDHVVHLGLPSVPQRQQQRVPVAEDPFQTPPHQVPHLVARLSRRQQAPTLRLVDLTPEVRPHYRGDLLSHPFISASAGQDQASRQKARRKVQPEFNLRSRRLVRGNPLQGRPLHLGALLVDERARRRGAIVRRSCSASTTCTLRSPAYTTRSRLGYSRRSIDFRPASPAGCSKSISLLNGGTVSSARRAEPMIAAPVERLTFSA